MNARIAGIVLAVVLLPSIAWGGLASNEHFIVFADNQPLADEVLAKAVELRRQLALEWLGEELPPANGRVVLHVELSDRQDTGRTWVDATADREYHMVWLNTTRDRAVGSTLAHEVVHLLFASHFKGRLPAWADEGVASLQDDAARHDLRRAMLQSFGNAWPDLIDILEKPAISPSDRLAYTVSASLTEFLVARGDKTTFLQFAADGKAGGWDQAARAHYGLSGIEELQTSWQTWASRSSTASRGARSISRLREESRLRR